MASKARGLADLGNAYSDGALSNRNMIINGGMQVAQRGTSVTGKTTAGYHTVDRWEASSSGSTFSQSQQEVTLGDSTVGGFQYFLRHEVTTGDDYCGLIYKVEDVRSVLEGTVTLSFYAKGTNPSGGGISMTARQVFGTGGTPSSDVIATTQTFILTASWQRFEFQITVPSLTGKTIGTGNNSHYKFQLTQPSSDDTANAWTLDITGVQLEVGDSSTPFEHRSYGDELARCQRYLQRFGTGEANVLLGMAHTYVGGASYGVLKYHKTMRANPTGTVSDSSAGAWRYRYGSGLNAANIAGGIGVDQYGKDQCRFYINTGTSASSTGWVRGQSSSRYILLDAEL